MGGRGGTEMSGAGQERILRGKAEAGRWRGHWLL